MTQAGLLTLPVYRDSTCPPGYRTTPMGSDIALGPTDRRDGPSRADRKVVRMPAIPAEALLVASVVVAGVAVARTGSLPRAAGIGFAVSIVLFVIGGIPDNGPWQSIAAALMTAATVWIAAAAGRRGRTGPGGRRR